MSTGRRYGRDLASETEERDRGQLFGELPAPLAGLSNSDVELRAQTSRVQRKAAHGGTDPMEITDGRVDRLEPGVTAGPPPPRGGGALPYLPAVQRAFGRHDVS